MLVNLYFVIFYFQYFIFYTVKVLVFLYNCQLIYIIIHSRDAFYGSNDKEALLECQRQTRVYNRWYPILVDLKTDKRSSLIVYYPPGHIDNRDIAEEVKDAVMQKWEGPLSIFTTHRGSLTITYFETF